METLTHSKRSTFLACRRAFFLRHEMRLRPRIVRGGLRRGTAFNLAIGTNDPEKIGEALADAYGEQYPSTQDEADELEFEIYALAVLARRYLDVYGTTERREVEYTLPLVNPDTGRRSRSFVLGGKIDGVMVTGHREAVLVEDKLFSQVTSDTIARLELDLQVSEYLDALMSKGWDAKILYRHTRWPSIRRRKSETLEQFCERFAEDTLERESFYFHEEGPWVFPTKQMEQFRRDRWKIAKDILRARRDHSWYGNPSRCDMFGGGCQFTPICTHQEGWADQYVTEESDTPELAVVA